LGTVQHFYVVFEMFAVQYAALGWLFGLAVEYLERPKKKILLLFALVSWLASPMAYAPTLWYAYVAGLGLFCLSYLLLRRSKAIFVRALLLAAITPDCQRVLAVAKPLLDWLWRLGHPRRVPH
jgi:hypothetical protein